MFPKYDTHLFGPNLSLADGYLVKSQVAVVELRQKITEILDKTPTVYEDPESPLTKLHLMKA